MLFSLHYRVWSIVFDDERNLYSLSINPFKMEAVII